jgi:hypothetical protein
MTEPTIADVMGAYAVDVARANLGIELVENPRALDDILQRSTTTCRRRRVPPRA